VHLLLKNTPVVLNQWLRAAFAANPLQMQQTAIGDQPKPLPSAGSRPEIVCETALLGMQ
jgi:hypothetical protein